MVSIYGTAAPAVVPPIVQRLTAIFESLPDTEFLERVQGPPRRGPKGWPVKVLFRCVLTRYILNLRSTAELLRQLRDNPYIAQACGLEWPTLPHEATLSRFHDRIARDRYALAKLKDVSRALVRVCYDTIPGFGKRVALDGTVLKGWANGVKGKRTDPDGDWAVKKNSNGVREFTFGFKLHLAVDCETELPIAANVSAGNVHDSQRATNLLREAQTAYSRFSPEHVLADSAYTSRKIDHHIKKLYGAQPVIQTNPAHKRRSEKAAPIEALPGWKALYAQRGAVERAFSRLKGQHALNNIRLRRLAKVTVHCYLSVIALQAEAIQKQQRITTSAPSVQVVQGTIHLGL